MVSDKMPSSWSDCFLYRACDIPCMAAKVPEKAKNAASESARQPGRGSLPIICLLYFMMVNLLKISVL